MATMTRRSLETGHGSIPLPTFFPVTTFGEKFPLDGLLRPYLPRYTPGIMVSHFYSQGMHARPDHPLFIDSGGFASLFEGSEIVEEGPMAGIRTKDGTLLTPHEVLSFQERHADIGATVDFLVAPSMDSSEALRRQELTIKNAIWTIRKRKNGRMLLFASLQAWDADSARRIMTALRPYPFDGFALGGMVPRAGTPDTILGIVDAIRAIDCDRPLHVFGLGQPALVKQLFSHGVDSTDSSSYVRYAADRKYLIPSTGQYVPVMDIARTEDWCECRVCRVFDSAYLSLSGELNGMALALHNLAAIAKYLGLDPGAWRGIRTTNDPHAH